MTLVELQTALRAADARAVLVPSRTLEHIIQEACNLRGSIWSTPHRKSYIVARQTLFRHVDQAYLDLEPDQLLPDTVILLARPPAEELSDLESKQVLLEYWRRLFHASVHLAMDDSQIEAWERFSPESMRQSIDEIGRSEFDEIRTVLVQDGYILPDADDRTVYVEFAAVFLETRFFAASLLPGVFPGLRNLDRIEQMLSRDVDARGLFTRTRLKEAPDPVMAVDTGTEEPESHERYWTLVRSAERAILANNTVRAAILRTRAWRIAPAALGQQTRDEALADMKRLMARVAVALRLSPAEADEWAKDLPLLLDKADQGDWPAEAKLLYDLQKICSDNEREIVSLDVVEWALSAGRRPIKRPLPSLRLVRIIRNLRTATRHLGVVRLHDSDRQHFADLMQAALARIEQSVREQFGRVLKTALQDVGLQPGNPPERVALANMVAEWLDRIITHGFLTFSDLRDTIARNQLKMPDLRDPTDLIRGDPLLRMDRRLSSLLDGVYRPSDVYMRWLEQLTAINFGTRVGRALTLWVTLPFGGAALMLQVLGIIFHLVFKPEGHAVRSWLYHVLVGPSRQDAPAGVGNYLSFHFMLLLSLGAFLMGVIHSYKVRLRVWRAVLAARRALKHAFVETPIALWRRASLQKLLMSWQARLLLYVMKPVAVWLILFLLMPQGWHAPGVALLLFLAAAVLTHSRFGQSLNEAAGELFASFVKLLRAGLVPGLFRLIMRIFKQVVDGVEFALFTVDDWLRYRTGDTQWSMVARTALGLIWFPIAYLARFFMLVLVEPGFNPAKAPVSYVAAKVMWPLSAPLTAAAASVLRPFVGNWLAYGVALPVIWLLPDVFGFLFWETRENWSLYKANRRRVLKAVPVGPHGETVKGLLEPGFHSGTIPRIYHRLRKAERQAFWTRNWTSARASRLELDEVARALTRFVARELLALLDQSEGWQDERLNVAGVELSVRRIAIRLGHAAYPLRPVRIEMELRETCLVASVPETGWLDQLTASQLHSFTAALASLYKLSGVDLVREQIQACIPSPTTTWDIAAEGLVLRANRQSTPEIYSLRDSVQAGLQRGTKDEAAAAGNAIDPQRLVFARLPLGWHQWAATWDKRLNGVGRVDSSTWHQNLVRLAPRATGLTPQIPAQAIKPEPAKIAASPFAVDATATKSLAI